MNHVKLLVILLTCMSGTFLTGCGGNVGVHYAPVGACADVDLDPSSCAR